MTRVLSLLVVLFVFNTMDVFAGWIQRSDVPANGRHRGASFSIGNKGYMGLGHYNGTGTNVVKKDWWEYDPSTNAWTQKADYIGNNGNGNYAPICFSLGVYGYLAGGTLGDAMLYRFDPVLNEWSPTVTCPTTPGNQACFTLNGKAYYISGTQVYEFDPNVSFWSPKGPAPFTNTAWNSAFTIGEKAYVKNGSSFWEYKSTMDSWTNRAYFPGLAMAASTAFTQEGKGYIICGYGVGYLSDINSEVWEYDPTQNAWSQLPDFPGSSRRFGSAFSIGDRAYIGMGTNGTNFNDFWEFDRSLSINELSDMECRTFPNPATTEFNIEVEGEGEFTFTLTDVNGEIIASEKGHNKSTINTTELKAGVYFINVTTLHGKLTRKLIVQ